jgi:2-polyprenyl-3-methyl-5-hydroxy-6-metoxy-1,4-benzoquinol methylase
MPIEVTVCPLCLSPQKSFFDRRSSHFMAENRPLIIDNHLCKSCGLVYLSPRMSDEELAVFYEQEYRQLYQGNAGPTKKDLRVQAQRAEHLLGFASNSNQNQPISSVTHHLDIGCSAGILLERFRRAFQSTATGIEPGEAYREYAWETFGKGDPGFVFYASLEELSVSLQQSRAKGVRFDLVSMIHVLEHMPDPVGYLSRLRQEFLAQNGWLLLEVPNLYAHDCFEIAHMISFSQHTLEQTLLQAGYQIIRIKAHGEPRSGIIPLYLTTLAKPATGSPERSPTPETGVQRKRQFGMIRRRALSRLFPAKAWKPMPKE